MVYLIKEYTVLSSVRLVVIILGWLFSLFPYQQFWYLHNFSLPALQQSIRILDIHHLPPRLIQAPIPEYYFSVLPITLFHMNFANNLRCFCVCEDELSAVFKDDISNNA